MKLAVLADMASVHTPRWCEALLHRGFDLRCFSLEPFDPPRDYATHVRPRLDPQKLRYLSSVDRVYREVAAYGPDVVVAVHMPNYGLIAAAMPRVAPTYLVGWGSDILYSAEKTPLHTAIMRRVVARADRINVDAEVMRTVLVDRYGYDADQVDLIYWGLPEDWYQEPVEPPPPGPPWRVVCHRRLDYDMDPLLLLEAFRRALADGFEGTLILKDHGPWRDKVRAWVRDHDMGDVVEPMGWYDYPDLRRFLRGAHIYTSSAWIDSTAVSLLEVMSQGLFPIVTDIPANREWVIDGLNGKLFHPRSPDALARALCDAVADPERMRIAATLNRDLVERKARWEQHMDASADAIRSLGNGAVAGKRLRSRTEG